MAARLHPDPVGPELVDLRQLSARDVYPLLQEETADWARELDWDFSKSAELVERFVDMHALNGAALLEGRQVVGYLYFVLEETKGLVGDLYIRGDRRHLHYEDQLLQIGLQSIHEHPHITRVESQILMLDYEPNRVLPFASSAASYGRNFMRCVLTSADLSEAPIKVPVFIERWADHYHDPAAQVIAEAYNGHVDSRVNDQYRSVAGARRFLYNIVQFPGCGTFFRPASYVAFEAATGHVCGISLASLVSEKCGHITQICVSSGVRGKGVGHEMMRRSLAAFKEVGCTAVSLTVTSANSGAVALYEKLGFRTIRRFAAYAWEWPA